MPAAIPKKLRRQAKALFVWYSQERAAIKMMHDENDVLAVDELVVVRDLLRKSKHACQHRRKFKVLSRIKSFLCYPKGVGQ